MFLKEDIRGIPIYKLLSTILKNTIKVAPVIKKK